MPQNKVGEQGGHRPGGQGPQDEGKGRILGEFQELWPGKPFGKTLKPLSQEKIPQPQAETVEGEYRPGIVQKGSGQHDGKIQAEDPSQPHGGDGMEPQMGREGDEDANGEGQGDLMGRTVQQNDLANMFLELLIPGAHVFNSF